MSPSNVRENICAACHGTGTASHRNGEACVEPIKCEECDGLGIDCSAMTDREFEQFIHQRLTGSLLPP
jgi:hypothetical protein